MYIIYVVIPNLFHDLFELRYRLRQLIIQVHVLCLL